MSPKMHDLSWKKKKVLSLLRKIIQLEYLPLCFRGPSEAKESALIYLWNLILNGSVAADDLTPPK